MRQCLSIIAALMLAVGCSSDSSLPNPTGKGSVRALNAVSGSPDIRFLVEERFQAGIGYKEASTGRRWDDFEYRFNFEVSFLGETEARRVATRALKVDADRDYTLVLTGAFNAPTVTVWETDERIWEGTESVFEARFGHTAPSLGSVDVYFAAEGTAPSLGEELGTLAFGEVLAPVDLGAGDYVLTLTSSGDPSDIVYQSAPLTYAEQTTILVPVFDGNEQDVAPYSVRAINVAGGAAQLPDVRVSPTVRIFQASIDLPPSDVYDDEMLTNLVLANHVFGDVTGDISIPVGATMYTYTAVGNVGAIQFESGIDAIAGTHNNFVVIGEEGARFAVTYVPNRRSVANIAKLRIFPAALNHEQLDIYVVDADTSIADANPTARTAYSLLLQDLVLDAGSYDVYTTVVGEKTVVSGPTRIDVQLGDDVEAIIFDTTDPATAEFRIIPAP